jgi:hypothetical protein
VRKIIDYLLWPDMFVRTSCVLGLIGVGISVLGKMRQSRDMINVGLVLTVPLLLGVLAIVVVFIPIVICVEILNRRKR